MTLCEAVRPGFWKDIQANRADWLGRRGRNIIGEHFPPGPRYVIRAPIVAFVVGTQKRKIITLGADVGRPETGESEPETSQVCLLVGRMVSVLSSSPLRKVSCFALFRSVF